jgi:hypothetical protein
VDGDEVDGVDGPCCEVAVVVDLLVMRTDSTTEIAFVPLTLFRIASGIADKSLPEDIMSVGMVDESRTGGWVNLRFRT